MIIGIAGKARSGKNTVAEMIIHILSNPKRKHTFKSYERQCKRTFNKYYESSQITAFANNLKVIAAIASGTCIDDHQSDGIKSLRVPEFMYTDATLNKTYRGLYQRLGDMFRNEFGDNYWIDLLNANIADLLILNEHTIISDVRYANESEFVKSIGGIVIKVDAVTTFASNHSSERLDNIIPDKVIFNDKSGLESLFNLVKKTVYELI